MNRRQTPNARRDRLFRTAALVVLLAAGTISQGAADSSVKVQLDVSKAGPRAVESRTEQAVMRDYGLAWTMMARALESNTIEPLQASFVGSARIWLNDSVAGQRRAGLTSNYREQNHKLRVVFYAPEGDVIELRDTAEFQLQIMDGAKVIYSEHIVRHYIVLMTPGADRWIIRQLQAQPEL